MALREFYKWLSGLSVALCFTTVWMLAVLCWNSWTAGQEGFFWFCLFAIPSISLLGIVLGIIAFRHQVRWAWMPGAVHVLVVLCLQLVETSL